MDQKEIRRVAQNRQVRGLRLGLLQPKLFALRIRSGIPDGVKATFGQAGNWRRRVILDDPEDLRWAGGSHLCRCILPHEVIPQQLGPGRQVIGLLRHLRFQRGLLSGLQSPASQSLLLRAHRNRLGMGKV